jgi:methylenetetrahydrofolate dehydrogenase (NADP+)/methenyltetrahydrofolate cyclohydrolase
VGAHVLDGKALAHQLRAQVAVRAAAFAARQGRAPGLATVLVGDHPASRVYVRNKRRAAAEAGIADVHHAPPADIAEAELLALVAALNADPAIDGILVQLPLPAHVRAQAVIEAVDPAKDVDGFHPLNAGRLASGLPGLVPCTPRGCLKLIAAAGVETLGADALVIGRSNIVGKPVAALLLAADATVAIAHSRSRDLPALARRADILIAAVGRAGMVRGDWVKPGATVIDVGINRTDDGRLTGDVAFDEAVEIAGAITPVPGGVGPMTIACLLENTLIAAEARLAAGR